MFLLLPLHICRGSYTLSLLHLNLIKAQHLLLDWALKTLEEAVGYIQKK